MKKLFFFLYAITLVFFAFFSYTFIDPNFIYLKKIYSGFAFNNRSLTTLIYIIFTFLLFLFYLIFYYLLKKKQLSLDNVKTLIGVTVVILLFSYPAMLSYDIFNYIATAKVSFFYHENPYVIMPMEFINDPLLLFMHAANKTALYGPSWISLAVIPYVLGFGNFLLTLLNFKIFIAVFYLITVSLIWKISKNLESIFLFALNPLVIIETLISGHNDIVMMFFALFALYLVIKNKIWQGFIFLIIAILIKYATLFLAPIFIFILYKILKNQKINWEYIFYLSYLFMMAIFFLSPLREEIYPWYAIWFLIFSFLFPSKRFILWLSIAFSFGLLLRYTPFIYQGSYLGMVQISKTFLTFIPPFFVSIYFIFNSLWSKKFYR